MIKISERAKQHLFRFALGIGTAVIVLLFIAIMPWFILKIMFFIAMAALLYVLGFIILEAFDDFKEMQRLEEEIKTKKNKR